MSDETQPDPYCAVCGRRLLPGERPSAYITRDGAGAVVCELCKSRAEAAGWLRPDEADALRAAGSGRERRRPRGQMLGGLLARLPAPAAEEEEEAAPARASRRPPGARDEAARAPAAAPDGADEAGDGLGATIPQALAAFNSSDHRRTVAGLTRTLGSPRATAIEVQGKDGQPGVRLTVAWELTWYQWDVGAGRSGAEVRESGKGETIDQLRAADRAWNLMVDTDGTLEQRSTGVEAAEHAASE